MVIKVVITLCVMLVSVNQANGVRWVWNLYQGDNSSSSSNSNTSTSLPGVPLLAGYDSEDLQKKQSIPEDVSTALVEATTPSESSLVPATPSSNAVAYVFDLCDPYEILLAIGRIYPNTKIEILEWVNQITHQTAPKLPNPFKKASRTYPLTALYIGLVISVTQLATKTHTFVAAEIKSRTGTNNTQRWTKIVSVGSLSVATGKVDDLLDKLKENYEDIVDHETWSPIDTKDVGERTASILTMLKYYYMGKFQFNFPLLRTRKIRNTDTTLYIVHSTVSGRCRFMAEQDSRPDYVSQWFDTQFQVEQEAKHYVENDALRPIENAIKDKIMKLEMSQMSTQLKELDGLKPLVENIYLIQSLTGTQVVTYCRLVVDSKQDVVNTSNVGGYALIVLDAPPMQNITADRIPLTFVEGKKFDTESLAKIWLTLYYALEESSRLAIE